MSLRSQSVFSALVFVALVASASYANAGDYGQLTPFWTDACTGFPDGTPDDPTLWQQCCVQHDFKYWQGGTAEQKFQADQGLAQCVSDVGQPVIGAVMMGAVSVIASPYIPTFYRWGYGWPKIRGFAALTPDEEQQVTQLTPPDLTKVPITKRWF